MFVWIQQVAYLTLCKVLNFSVPHFIRLVKVKVKLLNRVQLFAIPWTVGSSIHGIFQARVLEWVTISFSRGLPDPRDLHLLNGNNNSREPYGVFVRNDAFILIKHLELPIAHECSMRIGPYCLRDDCPYLCAFTQTFWLWKVVLESRKIRTHTMAVPKVRELFCFVFFLIYLFILTGGWLLYSIVVAFAIHRHELAMGVHVYPHPEPPQNCFLKGHRINSFGFVDHRACQSYSTLL